MKTYLVLGLLVVVLVGPGRRTWAQGELLIADWNPWIVEQSDNGFPSISYGEIPLSVNGDWTSPTDYAHGLLYARVEVRHMPVTKEMNWQWCFHQNGTNQEECTDNSPVIRGPESGAPAVVAWTTPMSNLGASPNGPINWSKPRSILNLVLRKGPGWSEYLSPYTSLNNGVPWAGEDPDEWFPMEIRFTAVVVADGATFSGWDHHFYSPNEALDATWNLTLPAELLSGSELEVEALVHLQRFSPDGPPPELRVDVSSLGGPESVSLVALTDSTYYLERLSLSIERPNGRGAVVLWIQQGEKRVRLLQEIGILPLADQQLLIGSNAGNWPIDGSRRIEPTAGADTERYQDRDSRAFMASPELGPWTLRFVPPTAIDPWGFQTLRLAFHPGDVTQGTFLAVLINDSSNQAKAGPIHLLGTEPGQPGVALGAQDWQVVDIPMDRLVPLDRFAQPGSIESIRLVGDLAGTFYLDDLRLVAATPASETVTVVAMHSTSAPTESSLEQNYPNPFNSATRINISLPTPGVANLAIYSLVGQRVVTLMNGVHPAGTYTVHWDGRDELGQAQASGVYIYRLSVGRQTETRKLLLLR